MEGTTNNKPQTISMATINPYLTFNGNCELAFNFYKSVFGGDFPYVGRYKDMPATEGKIFSAKEADKIMHIELPIHDETVLMGCDSSELLGGDSTIGNNIALSIKAQSKDEADRLFRGLSSGGQVQTPMSDTFWGSYFGMCTDKFGINWMVNFEAQSSEQQ